MSAFVSPDFSPGGSSTGSAVGLSAGFCAAAIGCETCGSIVSWLRGIQRCSAADVQVSPARYAGLYAFKPSGGLVSNAGIIPISQRVDTAGPMGKSTWDVAALLDQMVAGSSESYITVVEQAIAKAGSPLRFGVPRKGFSASDTFEADPKYTPENRAQADSIFASVVAALQGLIVKDPADIPDPDPKWRDADDEPYKDSPWVLEQTRRMLRTEFYEGINGHLASRVGGTVRSLADLVKWNDEHPVSDHRLGDPSPS